MLYWDIPFSSAAPPPSYGRHDSDRPLPLKLRFLLVPYHTTEYDGQYCDKPLLLRL